MEHTNPNNDTIPYKPYHIFPPCLSFRPMLLSPHLSLYFSLCFSLFNFLSFSLSLMNLFIHSLSSSIYVSLWLSISVALSSFLSFSLSLWMIFFLNQCHKFLICGIVKKERIMMVITRSKSNRSTRIPLWKHLGGQNNFVSTSYSLICGIGNLTLKTGAIEYPNFHEDNETDHQCSTCLFSDTCIPCWRLGFRNPFRLGIGASNKSIAAVILRLMI